MTDRIAKIETIEFYVGSFPWALDKLMDGQRVRRRVWAAGVSLEFHSPDVMIRRGPSFGIRLESHISVDDMLALDWTVAK